MKVRHATRFFKNWSKLYKKGSSVFEYSRSVLVTCRLGTIFIEKIMRLVVVKFNHRVPTVQLSSN